MSENTNPLWESNAESQLLEARLNGFWNPDYFNRILLPLLGVKAGDRVLDVGSGNGALTLLLARHLPGAHFTGVDITASLVNEGRELALQRGLKNVEFVTGDALNLPFPDGTFDVVVCQTLLIHLGKPATAISEMYRVLKPGGRLMAAEYHVLTPTIPIEKNRLQPSAAEAGSLGRLGQIIFNGYRASGNGDLQAGSKVPFLLTDAGFEVTDVRINDRVLFAFPPFAKATEQNSLAELQSWEMLIKDPAYKAWLTDVMKAGGGTEEDVTAFLQLMPDHTNEVLDPQSDFSFLWLANPVLLAIFARKP